ncbi:2185_t:CDS:2 [Cetraspora pellucida]|uniref:2185_t:CDS:1 n=1 Tax=Cetraspora pellucida TaxID=1433469 RepID=A0A9N9BZK3_9GLOM|nr:2185_t:CDS:2 [Cetraspora pellucida]
MENIKLNVNNDRAETRQFNISDYYALAKLRLWINFGSTLDRLLIDRFD